MHGIQFCVTFTFMFFKLLKCSEDRHTQPLLIKGLYADIKDFPHSVFIYANCYTHVQCGSSILNQKILLTAAHCINSCNSVGKLLAFAGHENIYKATVTRRGRSILFHENFVRNGNIYDIGLILLARSLPLGNTIKRVILIKQNSVGLRAKIAGWGNLNEQGTLATYTLRYARQIVKPFSTCIKSENPLPGLMCTDSEFVYPPRLSKGDSGSALITENYIQIGVAALRHSSSPSLMFFTNTSYFYDWIKEHSRLILNCNNNAQNKIRNYHQLNYKYPFSL